MKDISCRNFSSADGIFSSKPMEVTVVIVMAQETQLRADFIHLEAKIDRVAAELRQQISEVKQEIMRWVLIVGTALGLFQAGLTVLLKLLP